MLHSKYRITKGMEELKLVYLDTLAKESSCEIEVPTNRPEDLKLHRELWEKIKSTVSRLLADLDLFR
ncbi:MAG: hypothetical protein N3G21_02425 [Candidatus Hydrogenedentes bacterium]|nr:hypothetical protein [Candidatus Hydrogenedentota bacterium]